MPSGYALSHEEIFDFAYLIGLWFKSLSLPFPFVHNSPCFSKALKECLKKNSIEK